jgi:ankyrin repeat protein
VAVDLLLSVQPAVDSADRDGVTPLVAAIRAGDVAVVRRLLDAGAAAMGGSQRRNQPMRAAAEHGDVEILEALLSRRVDVDAVDEFGDTALIVAARGGHAEMCMKLLAAGANGRLRGRDRLTAAEVAEARGFTMLAQRLRS